MMANKHVMIRVEKYRRYGERVHIIPKAKAWHNKKEMKLKHKYTSDCITLGEKGNQFICVALPVGVAKSKGLLKKNKQGQFNYQVIGFIKNNV